MIRIRVRSLCSEDPANAALKLFERERPGDCVQVDVNGNRFDQQICFNHPDVRAYGIALYVDLAANYDIDFVMTCVRGFTISGQTLLMIAAAVLLPEAGRLAALVTGGDRRAVDAVLGAHAQHVLQFGQGRGQGPVGIGAGNWMSCSSWPNRRRILSSV